MSKAAGFRGKDRTEPDSSAVRTLSLRRGVHAQVQSFLAYRSAEPVQDQRARKAVRRRATQRWRSAPIVTACMTCGPPATRARKFIRSTSHRPAHVATRTLRYMKGYAIPTDQFEKYSTSVHHDAMVARGDLSAPTCTTCHGNHGAAPPGVDSVQNVCSKCHVFQDQMYEKSSHKAAFQSAGLPGCVVCHSNHGISHPTDAKTRYRPSGRVHAVPYAR